MSLLAGSLAVANLIARSLRVKPLSIEGPENTPPPPALCALPTLTALASSQASLGVTGIRVTGTRTAATDATPSNVVAGDFTTAFTSASALVQQNFVFQSMVNAAVDLNQPFGAKISFIDTSTFQTACEITLLLRPQGAINTGVALVDSLGGYSGADVLADNLLIGAGYEMALFVQCGGAGSAYIKDSLGNTFGPLKFNGTYNPANPLFGVVQLNLGTTINDQIVGDFNQGNQAFGVTDTGAVSWCNA